MPARPTPPVPGRMPNTSTYATLPCTAVLRRSRSGLAVLTRQGLTAWTRTLTELTPTPSAPPPAATDAPTLLPAALTRELVNILAALTLVST